MTTDDRSAWNLFTASESDPGRIRKSNEDAVFDYAQENPPGEPTGLLIVADGMGGHQAGEIASNLAVKAIYEELRTLLEQTDGDRIRPSLRLALQDRRDNGRVNFYKERVKAAIYAANSTIIEYANDHPVEAGNLGTTVACVFIRDRHAIIGNVGDSRVYMLRNTELHQLTQDHSLVHHLIRNGQIKPDEVYDHPHRSIITRALGFNKEVKVDIFALELDRNDRLLLCSDGLWEMIRDQDEISRCLREADGPASAAQALIDAANTHGGLDNIGVVVAEIVEKSAD